MCKDDDKNRNMRITERATDADERMSERRFTTDLPPSMFADARYARRDERRKKVDAQYCGDMRAHCADGARFARDKYMMRA